LSSELGRLDLLKYLVETFQLTVEDARANNSYALRWAAYNGHFKVVKYLIKRFQLGAEDVRAYNNYALRWGSLNVNHDIVQYFESLK
jgi:ankyrin repeat protein